MKIIHTYLFLICFIGGSNQLMGQSLTKSDKNIQRVKLNIEIKNAQQKSENSIIKDSLFHLMNQHIIHEGRRPVHSFLLYIENESNGFYFNQGLGTVGDNEVPVENNYQFKVASITKTFVSTVLLQLWEEGKISFEDKVLEYLSDIDYVDLHNVHLLDGKNYSEEITVRHLLQHRSGLGDIFIDTDTRFNMGVFLFRNRKFSPVRIMKTFYRYNLNKKTHFKPGEGYYYSDINYVLLGLIIQNITGMDLPQVIRKRIIEPLELTNTYFQYYEPVYGHGNEIHQFFNRIDLTKKINTSYEWAGGGIVSTNEDLGVFIKSLFTNRLFKNEETLETMTDISETKKHDGSYGMGIFQYSLNDKIYYGHGGYYGSLMIYNPEDKITLCANISQSFAPYSTHKLVEKILSIVENIE